MSALRLHDCRMASWQATARAVAPPVAGWQHPVQRLTGCLQRRVTRRGAARQRQVQIQATDSA